VTLHVRLIDGFEVRIDGSPIELPPSAQRVIAYIGLSDHPVLRPRVAGTLWLDTSDRLALGNLRSVLWRLRRSGIDLIETVGEQLMLRPDVTVDVRRHMHLARRLASGSDVPDGAAIEIEQGGELLPDWYDDWVLVERERYRQLRLHALERLCMDLTRAGAYAQAVDVGLLAVAEEPLRESGHRALIRVHLAEGNAGEALRQYQTYARAIHEELGLQPSRHMDDLVRGIRVNTSSVPNPHRLR
jgi:DNA-binding SARP family transcriptional activator